MGEERELKGGELNNFLWSQSPNNFPFIAHPFSANLHLLLIRVRDAAGVYPNADHCSASSLITHLLNYSRTSCEGLKLQCNKIPALGDSLTLTAIGRFILITVVTTNIWNAASQVREVIGWPPHVSNCQKLHMLLLTAAFSDKRQCIFSLRGSKPPLCGILQRHLKVLKWCLSMQMSADVRLQIWLISHRLLCCCS